MIRILTILFLFTNLIVMAQDKITKDLPFKSIPEAPASYDAGNIIVRMIEGLGYRYYWATEGLTEKDLQYKPSEAAQSMKETLNHIYGLSEIIKNTSLNKASVRPLTNTPESFESIRLLTLQHLEDASNIFKGKTPSELNDLKVIFERGGNSSNFPLWNFINGPLSDAIYHTGQVVSFRRTTGNPIQKGVNVFIGKTRESKE